MSQWIGNNDDQQQQDFAGTWDDQIKFEVVEAQCLKVVTELSMPRNERADKQDSQQVQLSFSKQSDKQRLLLPIKFAQSNCDPPQRGDRQSARQSATQPASQPANSIF